MYMGLTSLQVCMDSSDWLQGTIHDESSGLDSSSPSGDMLGCSRPLIERRLRPPHDQALKCPRCDSTHTKFCYYNNYSLSQPRYFCKTCRRYWTKGGTLRNIPVGGGCRKNKKVSKKSTTSTSDPHLHHHQSISNQNTAGPSSSSMSTHHHLNSPTDLHLSSFPDQMQFSQFDHNLIGTLGNPNNVMDTCNGMLENPRGPIDFMESTTKLEANNYDFMGNNCDQMGGGLVAPNFHGFCSPYGMSSSLDHGNGNGAALMDTCQRLMLPYYYASDHQDQSTHHAMDVKPNTKVLSLEWQDAGKESSNYGLINNLGSWTTSTAGMINGYGSSTSNPFV